MPYWNTPKSNKGDFVIKRMTLADHAEAWWKEKGNTVPPKGSDAYNEMYKQWAEFAFANMLRETSSIKGKSS